MIQYKRYGYGILIGFALMIMSSCSLYQQYHDKIVAKQACYAACKSHLSQCSHTCDQYVTLCNAKAYAIAAVHFNHYRHQQCVKGELVTLELNSFRDPLACLKMTCDCKQDYRMCAQSCEGSIYKRLQAVS